jgi:large subunit ribosomal protein L35
MEYPMPKMKTKSSAKKRFKVLGNGGVKRAHAFKRHILTKKTTKNKRQLRGTTQMVNDSDMASISKMLPYA